jgi:glutaredoxin
MKRIIFFITFFIIGLFLSAPLAQADSFTQAGESISEEEKVIIYFFDDRLCPVCKATKDFIQKIQSDYPEIDLKIYSITERQKLNEIVQMYEIKDYNIMAPTIFIGDPPIGETSNFFQFRDFTSRHEEMIIQAIEGKFVEDDCCVIKIPFLNIEIDIRNWSLPFATIILGSLDGFNVCSIGALILVLSIVMIFNSKKKMFLFGGLFILTAVSIYGTLVFVWGKLFETLIGHLEILRVIVGLASLGGGIYFLKEFWRFFKYGPTCNTSDFVLAKNATNKLKKAFETPDKGTWLLAGSIMFFAAAITIVELPCSIGVPVAFTGILVEKGLSLFFYTLYILAYLFFYMLIEMVIFTGAVLTKKIWFAGSKVITWITFAGSLVLFYLAFYYLFF